MMEIQSEWWKLEVMIIPSKSREIHTVSHYKTPTLHPHSKENQNRITQQSSKNSKHTHRSAYLIDYNPQITIKHRFTQQSLLSKCNHSNHTTTPSFPLPNLKVDPNYYSHQIDPPKHSSMQFPSQNKHTPSLLERIERVTRITPPTYHDQECTWRCYQRAPACRSVSSPRTPHGSTS